jgi:hypothetical protein
MYNMINHAGTRKRNDCCLKWFVYHAGRGGVKIIVVPIELCGVVIIGVT